VPFWLINLGMGLTPIRAATFAAVSWVGMLPATFLFGGLRRSHRPRRIRLEHGDVVVWGGPTRLAFHGVEALDDGMHPTTGACRINLTFRRAG